MTEYAFEGPKRASSTITWSFAGQNFAADAGTPFSAAIGSALQGTITAAFARWAGMSGLVFSQVADGPNVAIRIGFGSFSSPNELGETDFSYAGGVIDNDTLIRLLDPRLAPISYSVTLGYTYLQYAITVYQVALHEIGHALGLDHTTDPATIMYPYASSLNRDLGTGDIQGINTLYPYFTVSSANPVQVEGGPGQVDQFTYLVIRHGDPAAALTLSYTVTGASSSLVAGSLPASASEFVGGSFPSGQITFAAGSSTATLSVSVAGNAVPQADQGFALMLSAGDGAIVRGTLQGAVLDDDGGIAPVNGNAVGVYRFFNNRDGTHFFSSSLSERNTLILTRPDMTYEGLGLTAVATPATDSAAAPVFRFFDIHNGTHFYSVSTTERDSLLATRHDLTFEGTAFYEHATARAGDNAVYRFFDTRDGTHFYTASAAERATVAATRPDLRAEGIAFYAPTS